MKIRGIDKKELINSLHNYLRAGERDEIIIGSFSDEELKDTEALEELMNILADETLR